MKLKNVFYGIFLCSFASLTFASDKGDKDVFHLAEDQFNFGVLPKEEQSINKSVIPADIKELDDNHPLSAIAHPRDEAEKMEEHKPDKEGKSSDDVTVKESVAPAKTDVTSSASTAVQESSWFTLPSVQEISKQQLFALTAGAMVVGYGIYKVWDMFFASVEQIEEELKISLTVQDREVLFALIHAMAADIQNLRENKHEASLVAQVDLSSLSDVLASECKAFISNFIELYNAIDLSGNNIEFIIMFYGEFERAVQALLMQAEII